MRSDWDGDKERERAYDRASGTMIYDMFSYRFEIKRN